MMTPLRLSCCPGPASAQTGCGRRRCSGRRQSASAEAGRDRETWRHGNRVFAVGVLVVLAYEGAMHAGVSDQDKEHICDRTRKLPPGLLRTLAQSHTACTFLLASCNGNNKE